MKTQNQKGFTLVEIAIVLVIIGLLLGGVLKGQELIENAKIKAVANEAVSYQAAWNSYIDRYNAIPGDDANAVARFPGATGVTDGGGNNVVGGATEQYNVFSHLAAAGFIKSFDGIGSQYPPHKYNGSVQILANQAGGNFANAVCYSGLRQSVAEAIDRQIDGVVDGTQGSVRRSNNTAYAATNNTLCLQI